MLYIISSQAEELAMEDSFTNAVFSIINAPKGSEIYVGEVPTGISREHEAVQLVISNPYLRVCDAFETVRVSKVNGCSLQEAAEQILEADREPGTPVITEHLQYAGAFGIKHLFFTPANKWK